jgi:CDP-diacylglycerol--glycerol-3-phosphate 3-phosphatidyltransferase
VNLPNVLTVFRVFLTVCFIYYFSHDGSGSILIALVLFTLASITDFLDGYLARKHNLITPFGKIMDPIADKFLILSAFFMFMQKALIVDWMFYLIFAREGIVTVLRLLAMSRGAVLAAEGAGKLKTVLQIVAVYLIIIFSLSGQFMSRDLINTATIAVYAFMITVVFVTLWSGVSFMFNNRKELFRV